MKLTTIIPVHNAEKYITATLDSVLKQDLGNPEELEVICVDDASTDASVALIKDYQQKTPASAFSSTKRPGLQEPVEIRESKKPMVITFTFLMQMTL